MAEGQTLIVPLHLLLHLSLGAMDGHVLEQDAEVGGGELCLVDYSVVFLGEAEVDEHPEPPSRDSEDEQEGRE